MMKAGEEDPFLETAIPESVVPDTLDEDPRRYLLNTIDRYSFVVAIRENHSDTILFVGIVANPETA
jgi:serine protease inhibitor